MSKARMLQVPDDPFRHRRAYARGACQARHDRSCSGDGHAWSRQHWSGRSLPILIAGARWW